MAQNAQATETHEHRVQMRVPPATITRLDALRRAEPDLPNRSEMIRRLIDKAHEALGRGRRGAPVLASGLAELVDDEWTRPNAEDWAAARKALK